MRGTTHTFSNLFLSVLRQCALILSHRTVMYVFVSWTGKWNWLKKMLIKLRCDTLGAENGVENGLLYSEFTWNNVLHVNGVRILTQPQIALEKTYPFLQSDLPKRVTSVSYLGTTHFCSQIFHLGKCWKNPDVAYVNIIGKYETSLANMKLHYLTHSCTCSKVHKKFYIHLSQRKF
jgi:hypothetical protein